MRYGAPRETAADSVLGDGACSKHIVSPRTHPDTVKRNRAALHGSHSDNEPPWRRQEETRCIPRPGASFGALSFQAGVLRHMVFTNTGAGRRKLFPV